MKKRLLVFCLLCMVTLLNACKTEEDKESYTTQTEQKGKALTESKEWKPVDSIAAVENIIKLSNGKILSNLERIGKDSDYYCNLEANVRGGENAKYVSLVCKDPVYGITYYVNYGRNYYIYAMRDGVSELVVEIPAMDLYCREGELYFIANDFACYTFEDFENGAILKYNPVSGEVQSVGGQRADSMIVYPDGICFKQKGEIEAISDTQWLQKVNQFYFSFEEQKATLLENSNLMLERWKSNNIEIITEVASEEEEYVKEMREQGITGDIYVRIGSKLVDQNGKEQQMKMRVTDAFSMQGDTMYYMDASEQDGSYGLKAYNMVTGEVKEVVASIAPENMFPASKDFIIFQNVLYLPNWFRVSLIDGVSSYAQIKGAATFSEIEAFYTDGDTLFCLKDELLWIVKEVMEESAICEKEFIEGKPIEVGRYSYFLQELPQK